MIKSQVSKRDRQVTLALKMVLATSQLNWKFLISWLLGLVLSTCQPAMVFPVDTWEERTPKSQGVDLDKMQAALRVLEDFSGEDGVRETVIIRNGYLIFKGDNVENRHGVYSISKSITSTALGLLIDDLKATLDTQASEVEPLLHGQYDGITLRHFATMTSGYGANGPNRWNEPSDDWSTTPFDVGPPLFEPGTAYAYWDEAMIMFGRVLTRIAEQDLYSFVDARIMEPIGIKEWSWWHEEQVEGHDLNYGATGVALNALELARFGHLFLNEGNWNGRQLISKDWVRQATGSQVPASLALADTDRSSTDGRGIYGFNWWVNGINAAGKRSMPEAPPDLYYASGLHNNMCFVIPEWNMVVVRMGEDGNPTEGKITAYNRFFGRLSEAIMDIQPTYRASKRRIKPSQ